MTRRGQQLLELQQRFVNLHFGMFLHFNMAAFQDPEWGDPTSSPDLFHPTALGRALAEQRNRGATPEAK